MAEEGGGGYGDSGPSSAIGSTQRLPPPPAPQPPQPGSQAPPAPALAPDQLPQNNTLVALPIVAIENILSFMSYDEISQLRLVRPPSRPSAGPRSGEGRRGGRVPRGGSPPRAPPTPERGPPAQKSPRPSAPVSGACPETALASGLGGWGDFLGPLRPHPKERGGRWRDGGSPPPPGLSGGHPSGRVRRVPFVRHPRPAGVGGTEGPPRPSQARLVRRRDVSTPPDPLVGEGEVGSVGPPRPGAKPLAPDPGSVPRSSSSNSGSRGRPPPHSPQPVQPAP